MEDQSAFFTENKEIASQIGAYKFQKQPRKKEFEIKKDKSNKINKINAKDNFKI